MMGTAHSRTFVRIAAVATLAVLPAAGLAARSVGAATHATTLRLVAPARADVGRLFALHLVVENAPTLGALQANLRFDQRAVDVVRVRVARHFSSTGRVTPLSNVETPDRKLIAAFSCGTP